MNLEEYAQYDGMGLAELVRNGEVSCNELAELASQAIDSVNPALNFMAHRQPESEQMNGSRADNRPFQGVPFHIKEGCAAIKGQPLNLASR